jgi:parvulin-like peptidyl-prolyl isomerase
MPRVLLSFIVVILFACSAYAAEDIVVAKVNGTSLTQEELDAELDMIIPQITFHRSVAPEKRKQYYPKALEELVNKELQYQDAKTRDIKIDKEKITQQIEKFKKRFKSSKEYKKALETQGVSEEQLRAKVEKELLAQAAFNRAVTEKAKISDEAVKEYYDKNASRFKQPESVKLRLISTKEEQKARDISAKLKEGDDFADLASNLSEDSYRVRGGDVGYMHKGRMLPEIDEAAFKMKAGEVSEPIKADDSWFIIKVEDRKPEHQMSFNEIKGRLKKELEAEKVNELRKKWIDDLRAKAKIEILLKTD